MCDGFRQRDEEHPGWVDGSDEVDEDHACGYCYSPEPATGDAATAAPKKKPTPRKTPESIAKQRKQLEKDLATHKKTLEQTKKKIEATKKKLEIIKKKEIQQKKMLAQKKQKTQTKKSPQKQQKAMMVKKRIVEEQFYF